MTVRVAASSRRRLNACIQLVLYAATTLSLPLSAVAATNGTQDAAQQQRSGNADALQQMASQQLGAEAGRALGGWLGRLGTVEVDVRLDERFRLHEGAVDLLAPLSESERRLLFLQVGARHLDRRTTLNAGIGQRHFSRGWMLGYNAFVDVDPGKQHRRLGLGAEAWRDYLRFSANAYLRQSQWVASDEVAHHDERPANGFDVRAEGWLPAHPALGARVMLEKYQGEQVALFGSSGARESDPQAMTFGVSYSPVPALSLSYDHKRSRAQQDNTLGVQMTLDLGAPLLPQFQRNHVAAARTLAGGRHDLVRRNNSIVMEYREQRLRLQLPSEISGKGRAILPLEYQVRGQGMLTALHWNASALEAAGGRIIDLGGLRYQVELPAYVSGGQNSYPISAVAVDARGVMSATASTQVVVTGTDGVISDGHVTVDKQVMAANGRDAATYTVTVVDKHGDGVEGIELSWTTTLGVITSTTRTDSNGRSEAQLTSTVAGEARVSVVVAGHTALEAPLLRLVADAGTMRIAPEDFVIDKTLVEADGSSYATLQVTVKDAFGNPFADLPLQWSTNEGDLSMANTVTDADGRTSTQLKGMADADAQVLVAAEGLAPVNAPQIIRVRETHTYENTTSVVIPDVSSSGVTTSVDVSGRKGRARGNARVNVHITMRTPTDLKVVLVTPSGTRHMLQDQREDSLENRTFDIDLSDDDMNGTWSLNVSDWIGSDVGTLHNWSLTF